MNCAQPGGWDRLAQKVGQRRPAVGEVYQEQSVRWNRGLSARQGSPCFMFTTELRLFIPRRLQSLGLQIDWGHVRAARTLAALMNTVELNALELLCLRRNQKSLQSCWPADACCTLNFGSDSMGVSMADDISISNRVTVNHSSKQPQHMFLPQGTFTLSMCSR